MQVKSKVPNTMVYVNKWGFSVLFWSLVEIETFKRAGKHVEELEYVALNQLLGSSLKQGFVPAGTKNIRCQVVGRSSLLVLLTGEHQSESRSLDLLCSCCRPKPTSFWWPTAHFTWSCWCLGGWHASTYVPRPTTAPPPLSASASSSRRRSSNKRPVEPRTWFEGVGFARVLRRSGAQERPWIVLEPRGIYLFLRLLCRGETLLHLCSSVFTLDLCAFGADTHAAKWCQNENTLRPVPAAVKQHLFSCTCGNHSRSYSCSKYLHK